MNILEAVIRALIYLACVALAFFLIVWVLGAIGLALPAMVMNILRIIFVLVAVLVLLRLFVPMFDGFQWWPRGAIPHRRPDLSYSPALRAGGESSPIDPMELTILGQF